MARACASASARRTCRSAAAAQLKHHRIPAIESINQHYIEIEAPESLSKHTHGKEKLKQLINQTATTRAPGSGALQVEDGAKLAAETVT